MVYPNVGLSQARTRLPSAVALFLLSSLACSHTGPKESSIHFDSDQFTDTTVISSQALERATRLRVTVTMPACAVSPSCTPPTGPNLGIRITPHRLLLAGDSGIIELNHRGDVVSGGQIAQPRQRANDWGFCPADRSTGMFLDRTTRTLQRYGQAGGRSEAAGAASLPGGGETGVVAVVIAGYPDDLRDVRCSPNGIVGITVTSNTSDKSVGMLWAVDSGTALPRPRLPVPPYFHTPLHRLRDIHWFAPEPEWDVDSDGTFAYSPGARPEVGIFTSRGPARLIRFMDIPPTPVSSEQMQAMENTYRATISHMGSAVAKQSERTVTAIAQSAYAVHPAVTDIIATRRNTWWVRFAPRADSALWVQLDTSHAASASLKLDSETWIRGEIGDTLLLERRDLLGTPVQRQNWLYWAVLDRRRQPMTTNKTRRKRKVFAPPNTSDEALRIYG